jgi:RNA polymerase sigma-70 factor, ECF subfamily
MVKTMPTETDLSLFERLQSGDPAALEGPLERYGSRVYRLAYHITRNEADAQEVAQDVFLAVFRKIHTFERRAALGTWLHRVATNTALLKIRSRPADREVSLDSRLPAFLRHGHRAGDLGTLNADWSQTPEAELLSQETRDILSRAIAGLPAPYRAVLPGRGGVLERGGLRDGGRDGSRGQISAAPRTHGPSGRANPASQVAAVV